MIWHHVITLAEDFFAGMAAFAVWTHFDFEGWYEQRRIERGRRLEERARLRVGCKHATRSEEEPRERRPPS